MKMNELAKFDFPQDILSLWLGQESDKLLPLQEMAVKKHGLFGTGNLLIQAPTSSGKTFIGEMAAIHTALRRKKVVYLVPLKALAEEKYLDFKEKYEPYGIKVIISTRDHREFDEALESGHFSIAVVVYEKLAQFLVRQPQRFQEVELVIADELEILSDPDRGALVELLLTQLIRRRCRVIGLSAVIGHAQRLASWMQAELVQYDRRPVELRYGVLHGGLFRYRTYNTFGEGDEQFVDVRSENPWEIITETVASFVERGETCLVFVKARHEAWHGAERLAARLNLPAATHALEELRELEATHAREALMQTLSCGVGFHNADLRPQERRLVEKAFRHDEVRVLVSTSTLATGLNLPAQNVFIAAEKWRYDNRFTMPWKAPILRSEYENMGGRAGRYGYHHDFGRSILVAATPFDQETLWRRYVEGERESIEPRLAQTPLEDHILRLVAARICQDEAELNAFFESTLSGRWIWTETMTPDQMDSQMSRAIGKALELEMLTRDVEGRLVPTPIGQAATSKGIRMITALEFERWLIASEGRSWSNADLILAAAFCPDAAMSPVSLTTREYEHADYAGQLRERTEGDERMADVPLNVLRSTNETPSFEECRAIKAALMVLDWLEGSPVYDIEETYHTTSGQLLFAAEQLSWLIESTSNLASALGMSASFANRIATLSERVALGVREEELWLANLRLRSLSRSALGAMVTNGLSTPASVAEAPLEYIERYMSKTDAQTLRKRARAWTLAEPQEVAQIQLEIDAPVLEVDDRRPGEIRIDGHRIPLQDKQYRLIRLLAAHPGECVPNDKIYAELWKDSIVEPAQLTSQKNRLLERIRKALPERSTLVTTVPRRGLVLNLTPAQVFLHHTEMSTAA